MEFTHLGLKLHLDKKDEMKKTDIKFRICFWTSTLLSLLFATVNLTEFINVEILKQAKNYPFGGEGPTPWYYLTSDLYAIVCLVFGLLFMTTFLLTIRENKKKRSKVLLTLFLITIILIITQYLNGKVQ